MNRTSVETAASEVFHQPQHVRDIVRATWTGLIANIALAVFKLLAGFFGRSQAVLADGVNSLSDTTTDLAVLIGVHYWSREADESHPHGHGRIETLVTVFIAASLIGLAVGLVYSALRGLRVQHTQRVEWIALVAALVSMAIKEVLYRWTRIIGMRHKSPAVLAKSWDHRADVLTSIPVAIAVIGSIFQPAWWFLDHIGAIIVSVFIFQTGFRVGWPALRELTDASAPEETRQRIERIALETRGVRFVHAIRTRSIGAGLQVDLHVKVDPLMSVREGHDISEQVKHRLLAHGPDIVDVIVHLEPYETVCVWPREERPKTEGWK